MEATGTTTGSLASRLEGALWKSFGLLLSCGIIFESLRNTLTWYATKFWGGAGDTWQEMWTYFLEKVGYDEQLLYVLGTAFVANVTFFGLGSLYAWFDFSDISWIKKYKIQPGTNDVPERQKFIGLIKQVVFNQTIVLLPYLFVTYHLFRWRRQIGGPLLAPATSNYDLRTLPEFHWVLLEFAFFTLFEEIAFYYSHKLAHHRRVYKYIHKRHHEWTAPVGFTALYSHPLEHIVSNIGPVSLGPLVCGSHLATSWLWTVLAIANTINAHSGYHFPFFPSPEAHDFHHLKFNQCFGVLGILDYVHGTDSIFRSSKAYQRHLMLTTTTPMRELIPDGNDQPKKLDDGNSD